MNTYPIGILDSGLGGLSIWQSVRAELPHESIVYVGDHQFVPYSQKETPVIQARVNAIISYFKQVHKTKLVIIACNTATVAGIDVYRKNNPGLPIIGVVPVVKTAASATKTGHIAILSTPYTATSEYQKQLISTYAKNQHVYSIGCPNLVLSIEKGLTKGKKIEQELSQLIAGIRKTPVDVVVLGCTHYIFLRETFKQLLGDAITLLDSGGAVARHAHHVLVQTKEEAPLTAISENIFITTGNAQECSIIAKQLTNISMVFSHADIA